MKSFFKIPRLLLIVNIVLLVIIGYIVFGFVFSDGRGKSAIIEPVTTTEEESKNPNEETGPSDNPDIIIQRNLFGSSGHNSVNQNPVQKTKENPISVLKTQLHLLACAVIENVKTKVQDLYRIGDLIEGVQIEKIDRNKIILFNDGQREVLNLYVAGSTSEKTEPVSKPVVAQKTDASDIVNVVSPTKREINKKAFLARVGGMEAILKKVKVVPYLEDGKEKGVRITGLEDFSMARYVGFENGDIIQEINGSTVTNRRKAFQILRKVRSQSSINVQLLRNQEQKKLSFGIK
jgi:type II secretion system protein C